MHTAEVTSAGAMLEGHGVEVAAAIAEVAGRAQIVVSDTVDPAHRMARLTEACIRARSDRPRIPVTRVRDHERFGNTRLA